MKVHIGNNFRNMEVFSASVGEVKNLALIPEVGYALDVWTSAFTKTGHVPGILIGGLALGLYMRPRATTDVDLLFLNPEDIPSEVAGFKRIRTGAFQENRNHVELEVVTGESIKVPRAVVQKVAETAINHGGLKVASLEALIVLKAISASHNPRRTLRDSADIFALLDQNSNTNLEPWFRLLSNKERTLISELQSKVESLK